MDNNEKEKRQNIYDKAKITVGMLNMIITVGMLLMIILTAVSAA